MEGFFCPSILLGRLVDQGPELASFPLVPQEFLVLTPVELIKITVELGQNQSVASRLLLGSESLLVVRIVHWLQRLASGEIILFKCQSFVVRS